MPIIKIYSYFTAAVKDDLMKYQTQHSGVRVAVDTPLM